LKAAAECLKKAKSEKLIRRDELNMGIYFSQQAISEARTMPDLKVVMSTSVSAVMSLIENGFYVEALLLGKELGMDKIISKIPRSAIAQYERELEFARCAFIARELGDLRKEALYSSLAQYCKQSLPGTLSEVIAKKPNR
jgi:hypothetical protein